MRIQLNINGGSMEDVSVLTNIFNSYDIRVENIKNKPEENEMGTEFLPALMLVLPDIMNFVEAILPAIMTYIEIKKPSGTKHDIELVNGTKKIHITNEDGEMIDLDKIIDLCNQSHFFD